MCGRGITLCIATSFPVSLKKNIYSLFGRVDEMLFGCKGVNMSNTDWISKVVCSPICLHKKCIAEAVNTVKRFHAHSSRVKKN